MPNHFGAFEHVFREILRRATKRLTRQEAVIFNHAITGMSDDDVAQMMKRSASDIAEQKNTAKEKIWEHFRAYVIENLSAIHTQKNLLPIQWTIQNTSAINNNNP